MKILIIGASGTIGKNVIDNLKKQHVLLTDNQTKLEIIASSRNSKENALDVFDKKQLNDFLSTHKMFDAVVCTFGKTVWTSPEKLSDYEESLNNKALGQINVALQSLKYIKQGGSITLTSGIVGKISSPYGSQTAVTNAAIEAFVRSAASELNNIRINAVSPRLLESSFSHYAKFFPGQETCTGEQVAKGYIRSIYGKETGVVIEI
ncbi:SDR family oxidoreductase [Xenorhabdus mauleonii]|uniref:NAD(P)-dependent dehydrogenase, short-chain alcohol dehydrogenase family n=1 Tax=Xenorhabdus mauleonii TaxID=351675 RepID=A0A1I3PEM9_9GAMM|nr:short chain dehydrogenase [Xenorhabdus mauleonii]PHM44827.1 SDR family oxidoreductase [Xenorhabdus mauleonii]SFJ19942.1 NAD(P)-dependent dehydrogenase, short-chain alcohol dehydrogenase family [Xenorhabdus mauleonii]